MLVALILVLITALGGAALLVLRLTGRPLPLGLALAHGALGAAGLVVLLVQIVGGHAPGTLPAVALGLLVLAALGGFTAFSFHLRSLPIPVPLILVHALIAIAGTVCLIIAVVPV